jgi:molybdate transport system substrate-binding protein
MPAVLLLCLLFAPAGQAADKLRVAVASNFRATLEEINHPFEQRTGTTIVLSAASTGVLASQIRHGAPFDLFLAADRQAPASLSDLAAPGTAPFCYAVGRLVLAGGSIEALASPDNSLAIANPATAPYGRAAQQVIAREEFRPGATRKLVRGNNVIQAYQFWHSGAVELALLPLSVAPPGSAAIPAQWHETLQQHAIVLRSGANVDAYLKWLGSDTVRSLMIRAGYEPCP